MHIKYIKKYIKEVAHRVSPGKNPRIITKWDTASVIDNQRYYLGELLVQGPVEMCDIINKSNSCLMNEYGTQIQ